MNVPSVPQAHTILEDGLRLNPGPWGDHCRTAAHTARAIATAATSLHVDPDVAYVLALLHDVGRASVPHGAPDVRHILDGYAHLTALGFPDAARICLTHSFPIKLTAAFASPWGDLHAERSWVQSYLDAVEYTPYDRLIQLCDSLALPQGPVLVEKRFVDVALRHGVNPLTVEKWRAFLTIKADFDAAVGGSIYDVLPGVVENTFSTTPGR